MLRRVLFAIGYAFGCVLGVLYARTAVKRPERPARCPWGPWCLDCLADSHDEHPAWPG